MRTLLHMGMVFWVSSLLGCASDRATTDADRRGADAVGSVSQQPVSSPMTSQLQSVEVAHFTIDPQKTSAKQLLKVEQFTVDQGKLRLDYCVNNIFPHDIWICTSLNSDGPDTGPREETRLTGDNLVVRRRGRLEHNVFRYAENNAVYRRLAPEKSYRDSVLSPLPVRNVSPVYWENVWAPDKFVFLKRVVFELGYFDEDLPTLLKQSEERGWGVRELYLNGYVMRTMKTDPNVAFVTCIRSPWPGLGMERSVQVAISDVTIAGTLRGIFVEDPEKRRERAEKSRQFVPKRSDYQFRVPGADQDSGDTVEWQSVK